MALVKTVTKMFPTENHVGFHLVVTDDERPDLGSGPQVVINSTFSANIPISADMTLAIQTELGNQAQAEIDRYKALKARYDIPAYQTKVNQINNALEV